MKAGNPTSVYGYMHHGNRVALPEETDGRYRLRKLGARIPSAFLNLFILRNLDWNPKRPEVEVAGSVQYTFV